MLQTKAGSLVMKKPSADSYLDLLLAFMDLSRWLSLTCFFGGSWFCPRKSPTTLWPPVPWELLPLRRGSALCGFTSCVRNWGTQAMPYATMLISQFGGDEFDTGSCLGFAPAHRTGPGNTVTQRDWQVPSPVPRRGRADVGTAQGEV